MIWPTNTTNKTNKINTFNIGDRVRVKSYEAIRLTLDGDETEDTHFNGMEMIRFCGQEYVINAMDDMEEPYRVLIELFDIPGNPQTDVGEWCWVAPWIEPAVEPVMLDEDLFIL